MSVEDDAQGWVEGFEIEADTAAPHEVTQRATVDAVVLAHRPARGQLLRRARSLAADPVVVAASASALTVASGVAVRLAARALTGQRAPVTQQPTIVLHHHVHHVIHHVVTRALPPGV